MEGDREHMAIYVAIVEAGGAGPIHPLWTSRDPELLRLIREQIERRLTPEQVPKQIESKDKGQRHG
jgi:hypothetical protein